MTSNDHLGEHAFAADWWEQHYRDADGAAPDQPGDQLVAEVTGLRPGTALEAGCGTGAGASWLAGQGWHVTALDISPTAIARARDRVAERQPELTGRIEWLVADLTSWQPLRPYDLVISQYVHPDQPFTEFVANLAGAVAPGGTLLVVGHDDADNHSAAHAPQPASIQPDAVLRALGEGQWQVSVAEARTRQITHGDSQLTMTDLVVKARRNQIDGNPTTG